MPMKLVALVSTLAVLEVMVFGALVGRGRALYGVPAPATSGHPTWERLNRVHLNSVEQLVVFLPFLWIFAFSVSQLGAACLGLVFVVARILYAVGYARDPARRAPGAFLTFGVQAILGIGSLIGAILQIVRS
jgi:uncharacterized membrane protein YecN with MAPEG domain